MTSNTPTRRRPSLGGEARKRPKTASLTQAGDAIKRMESIQAFIDRDQRDVMYISPSDIRKTFNARFIPCSLDEFSDVAWPSVDMDIEDAKAAYPAVLEGRPWFDRLSLPQQEAFFSFLGKVHFTAQSMVSLMQAQPITLEREHEGATEYFIVDGERRTLSCLYTQGKIPVVKAQVFNKRLDKHDRALLKDVANTGEPLTTYENILSKQAIYEALPAYQEMSLRELGKFLRMSRNQAGWFKMIMTHPKREALLKRVDCEKLGWRQIKFLLDNGVTVKLVQASPDKNVFGASHGVTKQPVSSSNKTHSDSKSLSGDAVRLKRMIDEKIGYACKVDQAEKSDHICLSFTVNSSQFEDLLASLKPVELDE